MVGEPRRGGGASAWLSRGCAQRPLAVLCRHRLWWMEGNDRARQKTRADAVASLQRYFDENLPEPIGDLPAGMLLDFFLE